MKDTPKFLKTWRTNVPVGRIAIKVKITPEACHKNNRRWSAYPRGTGGRRPLDAQPRQGLNKRRMVSPTRHVKHAMLHAPRDGSETPSSCNSTPAGVVHLGGASRRFRADTRSTDGYFYATPPAL